MLMTDTMVLRSAGATQVRVDIARATSFGSGALDRDRPAARQSPAPRPRTSSQAPTRCVLTSRPHKRHPTFSVLLDADDLSRGPLLDDLAAVDDLVAVAVAHRQRQRPPVVDLALQPQRPPLRLQRRQLAPHLAVGAALVRQHRQRAGHRRRLLELLDHPVAAAVVVVMVV